MLCAIFTNNQVTHPDATSAYCSSLEMIEADENNGPLLLVCMIEFE